MSALGWFAVSLIAAGKFACFGVAVRNALRPRAATAGEGPGGDDRHIAHAGDDSHEFPLLRERS